MTPEQRSKCMSHNRAKNTGPEMKLRLALWRLGFRYRVNDKRLPGKPDIVLPKYRTVIFVHGCFWHGHNGCKYYTVPKTNTEFWTAKVARNKERDQDVWRKLEAVGWNVIIVWECELTKNKFQETTNRVATEITLNGQMLASINQERREVRERYRQTQRERKELEAFYKNSLKA